MSLAGFCLQMSKMRPFRSFWEVSCYDVVIMCNSVVDECFAHASSLFVGTCTSVVLCNVSIRFSQLFNLNARW